MKIAERHTLTSAWVWSGVGIRQAIIGRWAEWRGSPSMWSRRRLGCTGGGSGVPAGQLRTARQDERAHQPANTRRGESPFSKAYRSMPKHQTCLVPASTETGSLEPSDPSQRSPLHRRLQIQIMRIAAPAMIKVGRLVAIGSARRCRRGPDSAFLRRAKDDIAASWNGC